MTRRMLRSTVAAAALLAAAWGCATGPRTAPVSAGALEATRGSTAEGDFLVPPKWEDAGVEITAQKAEFDDDMLELHLTFLNKTGKTLVVDRNQITFQTPDGRVFARDPGMFGLANIEPIHSLP